MNADYTFPAWYNGKIINEALFCRTYLSAHPTKCYKGSFYTENGRVADEMSIGKDIYDEIIQYAETGAARKVHSILSGLRFQAQCDHLPVQLDRIHVANGTLFTDGRFIPTKELCRNRLPVAYIPNAPTPEKWIQFLNELLEPIDILSLQEYLGYCLIPSTKAQKLLVIKGDGGEGKSRVGNIMRGLLGDNLKYGSIAKVEHNQFAAADLENMLCMVDDDMKTQALKSTDHLKSIVTAETPIDLEKKGKQSYQGDMYARFLVFSNGDLQALYDLSDGFFRRQLILSTKRKAPDRRDDPNLGKKLRDEIEGIFLWCFEGLQRLIAQDFHFTVSDAAKANLENARLEADNVRAFLRSEGYFLLDANSSIPTADLYVIYKHWCEDNAIKPLPSKAFTRAMNRYADLYHLEYDNHVMNRSGKRVNGFRGIKAYSPST